MWRPGHRHASGIRRPTPLRLLPEHGPGPIGRNARLRYSTGGRSTAAIRSTSKSATSPATRRRTASGVRHDVATDGADRRAPAAAAPDHGARAARSAAPGGRVPGALLCRFPRPRTQRRGRDQDRQARHDANEPGPISLSSRDSTASTSATSPRSTASRSRS